MFWPARLGGINRGLICLDVLISATYCSAVVSSKLMWRTSSFCVRSHLLYALFSSCTALCTTLFHHHVSLCILWCPVVTPQTSFAASKVFLFNCFHPPLFMLFVCCTFTSNCHCISSSFNFHSFIFFLPRCFFFLFSFIIFRSALIR